MRILFIASDLRRVGGIQQYNLQTIRALESLGHEVRLLELRGGIYGKFKFAFGFIGGIASRPGLIMCSHVHYSVFASWAGKLSGAPYTLALYGLEAVGLSERHKNAIRSAGRIVLLFSWTRRNLLAQVPEAAGKISMVMSTADPGEFTPAPKPTGLLQRYGLNGKKVILTMSRISREEEKMGYKGYGRVFEAMPQILKAEPDARYLLVGGGDYLAETKKRVTDLGLRDKVIMPGQIENSERAAHYNLADVFILPSKDEGCPAIVLLEAMFCAKPVITGNRECQPDDLCSGETGMLIDPDDINAIAQAVLAVLSGREPKLKGAALREKAIQKYGPERFRKDVAQMLRETLSHNHD